MAQSRTDVMAEPEQGEPEEEAPSEPKPFKLEYFSKSGKTVELNQD